MKNRRLYEIIIWVFVLTAIFLAGMWTIAYAQKTKTQMNNEVNTNFPDNTTNAITPAILRTTILDIIQSYIDLNGVNNFSCPAYNSFFTSVTLNAFTCLQNNAFNRLSYHTGYVTNIASMNKFSGFTLIPSAINIISLSGSAPGFGCFVNNPTISLVACFNSNTCFAGATGIATLATVTVTAQGQLAQGTVLNSTVTAGNYVAWIVGFPNGSGGCNNTSLIGEAIINAQ